MASVFLGSIYATAELRTDAVKKGVAEAKSELSSLEKSSGKSANTTNENTRSIGESFLDSAKSASLAASIIVGGMGLISGMAIQNAIDFRSARVAFDTLTGSVELGGATFKKVSDYARATPFTLPQVVAGAQQLLAFGVTADDLIPTFNMLGNLSAGNAEKMGRLTLAFGQVKAAGKLMGQDLNQFAQAGIPLLGTLAEQFGVTQGEARDMISAGEVSFGDVQKALEKLTGAGGKFNDLIGKQSKELGGQLSNLQDNFTRLGATILGLDDQGNIRNGSIFFYLSQGATKLNEVLDQIMPSIAAFTDNLLKNQSAVVLIGGAILGLIALALVPLVAMFIAALPMMIAFALIGATIAAVAYLIYTNWGNIVNIWNIAVATVQNLWKTLTDGVVWLRDSFIALGQIIIDFFTALPGMIMDFLLGIVLNFFNFWGLMLGLVIYGVPAIINAIMNWFSTLPAQLKAIWDNVVMIWDNTWKAIVNFVTITIPKMIADIFTWFMNIPKNMTTSMDETRKSSTEGFSKTWDAIVTELSSWPGKIFEWGKKIMQAFADGIKSAVGAVSDAFKAGLDNARKFVQGNSPPVAGPFKNIDVWGFNVGMAWVDGMRAAIAGFALPQGGFSVGMTEASPAFESSPVTHSPQFTIQLGTFIGTETEKRQLAYELQKAYDDYAKGLGR